MVTIAPSRKAWTLVKAGPARRLWGFHTETGWVDWKTYLGIDKVYDPYVEDIVQGNK